VTENIERRTVLKQLPTGMNRKEEGDKYVGNCRVLREAEKGEEWICKEKYVSELSACLGHHGCYYYYYNHHHHHLIYAGYLYIYS
jgi:hypothetical protein